MARVVIHIGRLVVHGARGFAAESFREGLQRELAQRIAAGPSAVERASTARAGAHTPAPEASAAAQVAAQLFRAAPGGQP